jgi:hypothetical protein
MGEKRLQRMRELVCGRVDWLDQAPCGSSETTATERASAQLKFQSPKAPRLPRGCPRCEQSVQSYGQYGSLTIMVVLPLALNFITSSGVSHSSGCRDQIQAALIYQL